MKADIIIRGRLKDGGSVRLQIDESNYLLDRSIEAKKSGHNNTLYRLVADKRLLVMNKELIAKVIEAVDKPRFTTCPTCGHQHHI